MNREEIKVMAKDCVYSEEGITYMSDKQYNNYIDIIEQLQQENEKYKEVINKANKKLNNFIECCKAEKLESGSDYLHHQYWDMFERFNKQIKDILKEVK